MITFSLFVMLSFPSCMLCRLHCNIRISRINISPYLPVITIFIGSLHLYHHTHMITLYTKPFHLSQPGPAIMFSKSHHSFLELSNDIQDEHDWVIGHLKTIDIPLNITAFAVEPVTKLLAVGEL